MTMACDSINMPLFPLRCCREIARLWDTARGVCAMILRQEIPFPILALLLPNQDVKSWCIAKDSAAGKYGGQEEKGATEDETVGWHYRLNGHEFEQMLGDGEGQGRLACCSAWGRGVRHDWVLNHHHHHQVALGKKSLHFNCLHVYPGDKKTEFPVLMEVKVNALRWCEKSFPLASFSLLRHSAHGKALLYDTDSTRKVHKSAFKTWGQKRTRKGNQHNPSHTFLLDKKPASLFSMKGQNRGRGARHKSFFFLLPFIFISWGLITLQYCSGFCHTLTF